MSDLNVTFTNDCGDSRHFSVADLGRDSSTPPMVFNGYLDAHQTTDVIVIQADGKVEYQRSDGPLRVIDGIHDGDNIRME